MIRNYLKSALRNITRNKFYSVLNILGLSIGLISTIFILLYIQDELSFDKYNKNYKRIYRLESDFRISEKHDKFAVTSVPIAPAMKMEYPEIEQYTRIVDNGNMFIRYKDKEFYEKKIYSADSSYFKVFTCEFLKGSPDKALTEPNTMVVTESFAKKYFGEANPLGEVLRDGDNMNYKVTAVIKDLPGNTHLKYDALTSMATIAKVYGKDQFNSLKPEAFWNVGIYSYILLKPNADIKNIHAKFPAFNKKYMEPLGKQINADFKLITTNLADIHLSTKNLEGDLPRGSMSYVYIFSFVALFILLIASINYMNMATSRSANRAKEVGIRKVFGAFRAQLSRQFLSESVLLAFISLIISLAFIQLLLPLFNELSDKHLTFGVFSNPFIFIGIIAITLVVGLISGSYPAFYLSSFMPARVLKGKIDSGRNSGYLRKTLVVFQFVISIMMIIGTLTVSRQLRYMKTKDLGFDKGNIVVAEIQDTVFVKKIPAFREELLQNPTIEAVSASTGVPGKIRSIQVMRVENGSKMQELALNNFQIDYDYIPLMKMKLVKGRNFDKNMGTDLKEGAIINETAAKKLGWGDNALGKKIQYGIELDGTADRNTKVIGVVKDFNYASLHNKIEPIVMFLTKRPGFALNIRIKPENKPAALDFIKSVWGKYGVKNPFEYYFLDQNFDESYQAEAKLNKIFTVFSVISIFIALLGLLGLASFTAERRTKEIGIRKVLGSSLMEIANMFYKEFTLLIVVAFIIGTPIAFYALGLWLQQFAYHVNQTWFIFFLSGMLAWIVAMATISFHSIKAASENPVTAIKYE
ncbi:MAG TPA: ABC transporter permease [Bacteroidales bacterium]|nr:ABC transporter permease [Bacteroidales bacterium]